MPALEQRLGERRQQPLCGERLPELAEGREALLRPRQTGRVDERQVGVEALDDEVRQAGEGSEELGGLGRGTPRRPRPLSTFTQTAVGSRAAAFTARPVSRSQTVGVRPWRRSSAMPSGSAPGSITIGSVTPASRTATASSNDPVVSSSTPSRASVSAAWTAPCP